VVSRDAEAAGRLKVSTEKLVFLKGTAFRPYVNVLQ